MTNVYEFKGKKINLHIDESVCNKNGINVNSALLIPEGFRSFASLSDCKMCEEMGMKTDKACQGCFELFRRAKAEGIL